MRQKTIDDFEGFESNTEDFFGDVSTVDPIEETEEEKKAEQKKKNEKTDKEDSKKEETKDSKKSEEQEEEVGFFSEEESEEEEDNTKGGDKKKTTESLKSEAGKTLEFLKGKNIFSFEEDEEITDENADDLLEDKWEEAIEYSIKERLEGLPEEGKNFLKFVSKGGNANEYLKTLSSVANSPINKDSDISDVKIQEASVKEDLKMQGYDEEYIETHIKVLKDSGKLEDISKKAYDKIVGKQKEAEEQRIAAIEQANKNKKEQSRKFKTSMSEFLRENKEVDGYKITPKEKKDIVDYVYNPNVELEDGRKITGIQADIFKAMGDKKKLVLLSKIFKNDFDLSFVADKAVSEDNKKKRDNLRNTDKKVASKGGSQSKTKKPIWELI